MEDSSKAIARDEHEEVVNGHLSDWRFKCTGAPIVDHSLSLCFAAKAVHTANKSTMYTRNAFCSADLGND